MNSISHIEAEGAQEGFAARVVNAVLWRSGSQMFAQAVMWACTFFVLRLLEPADYGLYAMTQSVLVLFSLLNGQGFASALVRAERVDEGEVRQVFGLLLLLNGGVALVQLIAAPFAARFYGQPLVANMLAIQALLYLANPLIVLPAALLGRRMDFRRQGVVNLLSALAGAMTSLGCALAGWGVWTLVAAPMAMAWTRAIGMTIAAGLRVWPSFRLAGAGATIRFGGALMLSTFLWLIQTQADIVIGGRMLDAHQLGLYTTSLFLAQIVTTKFVPPLNEVAFTAYARLQGDIAGAGRAFEKSVRIIMLVALPFYLGLAVTAEPFVRTVLGEKWAGAVPVVRLLALAMPLVTLQILFTPATTALGRPRIQVISAAIGALIMPAGFLIGVRHGVTGLATAWLLAFPLLAVLTAWLSVRIIGTSFGGIARAVSRPLVAALGMAGAVLVADRLTMIAAPAPRLALLVGVGGVVYATLVLLVARSLVIEVLNLVRRRV